MTEQNRPVSIGTRLRDLRESLGMTQAQLAQRAGVSKGTIGKIEAGLNEKPTDSLLSLLSVNGIGVPTPALESYLAGELSADAIKSRVSAQQLKLSEQKQTLKEAAPISDTTAELEAAIEEAMHGLRLGLKDGVLAVRIAEWCAKAISGFQSSLDDTEYREMVSFIGKEMIEVASLMRQSWKIDPDSSLETIGKYALVTCMLKIRDEQEALANKVTPADIRRERRNEVWQRKVNAALGEVVSVIDKAKTIQKAVDDGFGFDPFASYHEFAEEISIIASASVGVPPNDRDQLIALLKRELVPFYGGPTQMEDLAKKIAAIHEEMLAAQKKKDDDIPF